MRIKLNDAYVCSISSILIANRGFTLNSVDSCFNFYSVHDSDWNVQFPFSFEYKFLYKSSRVPLPLGGGGGGMTGYVLSSNRKNAKWIIKHTCAALNNRVKTSLLTLGKEPILKCHVVVQRSQQWYALFSHKCNFNLNHSWPENTRFWEEAKELFFQRNWKTLSIILF